MVYPQKLHSYLAFALMLSLLSVSPLPSFAACKNSGGSAGSTKLGSQVSGGSVTVCAAAAAVTPARAAIVKVQVKVVAKLIPKNVSKEVAKKPLNVNPVVKKPVVKKTVTKKTLLKKSVSPASSSVTSATQKFTPTAVIGSVYPSNQLTTGQSASFVSSSIVHYRTGTILKIPTEVRFTPISVDWNFGSGTTRAGSQLSFAFDSTGPHLVSVSVVYAVAYRVRGSSAWINEPDTIITTDELLVEVNDLAREPSISSGETLRGIQQNPRKILLVGEDCFARPYSFGCN